MIRFELRLLILISCGLGMCSETLSQLAERQAGLADSRVYYLMQADGTRQKIIESINMQPPNKNRNYRQLMPQNALNVTVNSTDDAGDLDLTDNVCADAGGNCTLRAAVEQINAAGGGEVQFNIRLPATISISNGPIYLDSVDEISIRGPGADLLSVRWMSGNGGVFNVISQRRVSISGITVENAPSISCITVEFGSELVVERAVIQNCGAFVGGGIASFGIVTVKQSTLRQNTSSLGGAIFIAEQGKGTILDSTINDNTACQGGGINNNGDIPRLTVINTTIAGNVAVNCENDTPGYGAGIFNYGPLELTNVTIANNTAEYLGGGIADFASVFGVAPSQIRNTIVASNLTPSARDVFTYGIVSLGNNLIGAGPANGMTNGINGDIVGVNQNDLGLDILRDNGGPTQTMALSRSSRARNAGNNCVVLPSGSCLAEPILTDQRGNGFKRRIGGKVDIGAYELQPATDYDFDGDSLADASVFRPTDGAWYLQQSAAGLFGTLFGFGSDRIAPADYDGDGRTDIAVYRPSTGIWYVFKSSNGTVEYYVFGLSEDLPTPADYDGDGKADVSVYRPSTGTWYRQNSSDGSYTGIQFGASEDKPTVGDFDGDGKADIAVFRPSTGAWYRINSADNSLYGELFGFGTDLIAPADYDGDGKTDLAAYRPTDGIWYLKYSSNSVYDYKVFGLANDIPAPADFDGDGKADVCVFRPSDGTWYRQNSSNGAFVAFQFGTSGDRPTMTAFRY